MKLGLAPLLFALATAGCGAFGTAAVATAIEDAPVLVGVACDLASDQGASEPGWESWLCTKLDPVTGERVAGTTFTMRVVKGHVPLMASR